MTPLKQACQLLQSTISKMTTQRSIESVLKECNLSYKDGSDDVKFSELLKMYGNKADYIRVFSLQSSWTEQYIKMKEQMVEEFTIIFKLSEKP